jgi:hypothetical protein
LIIALVDEDRQERTERKGVGLNKEEENPRFSIFNFVARPTCSGNMHFHMFVKEDAFVITTADSLRSLVLEWCRNTDMKDAVRFRELRPTNALSVLANRRGFLDMGP